MKRILIPVAAAVSLTILLSGCEFIDRGECLNYETNLKTVVVPDFDPDGYGIKTETKLVTECAAWEFPTGRPKKPR